MSDSERPLAPSAEHPPAPPPDDVAEPERSGPLTLERHRKADGRLLILYRAVEEELPGGRAGGGGATAAEDR